MLASWHYLPVATYAFLLKLHLTFLKLKIIFQHINNLLIDKMSFIIQALPLLWTHFVMVLSKAALLTFLVIFMLIIMVA